MPIQSIGLRKNFEKIKTENEVYKLWSDEQYRENVWSECRVLEMQLQQEGYTLSGMNFTDEMNPKIAPYFKRYYNRLEDFSNEKSARLNFYDKVNTLISLEVDGSVQSSGNQDVSWFKKLFPDLKFGVENKVETGGKSSLPPNVEVSNPKP